MEVIKMASGRTGKREKWTEEDRKELSKVYSMHPLQFTNSLIDRHGREGCYYQAQRMGLSHKLSGKYLYLKEWPETTKAYLAGIIDGEGTITICNQKWKRKYSSGVSTRPMVAISNTDYGLLKYLNNLNVGGVSYDRRQHEGWKQSFQWSVSSHLGCLSILRTILPYLVIKKKRAEEVIKYIEEKHPNEVYDCA